MQTRWRILRDFGFHEGRKYFAELAHELSAAGGKCIRTTAVLLARVIYWTFVSHRLAEHAIISPVGTSGAVEDG